MRLVDEPKSGAIWWNYFFSASLISFAIAELLWRALIAKCWALRKVIF
jgi:hypothetical protein